MDLSDISHSGAPFALGHVGSLDRIVLMGQSEDVEAALVRAGEADGAVFISRSAALQAKGDPRARRHALRTVLAAAPGSRGQAEQMLTQTAALFGLHLDRSMRLSAVEQPARFYLTILLCAAALGDAQTVVAQDPMGRLTGGPRSSIRARLLDVCARRGLGLVMSSANRIDAAVMATDVIVLEKGQLADRGELGDQLSAPRSNLAASLAEVNVFSGLARRGWLSIGHSQVRARTELDGKVFVTIPYTAAALSTDEFDPAFSDETVFEAVVTAIRDTERRVLITLSPADTEVGLTLTAVLWDFSAPTAPPQPAAEAAAAGESSEGPEAVRSQMRSTLAWGVVHPGLGATVAEQRRTVITGARLWVQVDTSHMRAYPVDNEAPTAAQTQ